MNTFLKTAAVVFIFLAMGCNNRQTHHDEEGHAQISPNQELYNEVMNIHDEVMPKMNDLHKAKTTLRTRLQLPGVPVQERRELEIKIARLDSASEGMMVWMRQFNPPPDSLGEEKARAYLKKELVKVKKVRDDILSALESTP